MGHFFWEQRKWGVEFLALFNSIPFMSSLGAWFGRKRPAPEMGWGPS